MIWARRRTARRAPSLAGVARVIATSVLLLVALGSASCSNTPFGYALDPIGTAFAPRRVIVVTKLVMPTAKIVVVTPTKPVIPNTLMPPPAPEVEIIVDFANVRAGPGTNYSILGGVQKGAHVRVLGTSPEDTWLSVEVTLGGIRGWITKGAVDPAGNLAALPTVLFQSPIATHFAVTTIPPTATKRPTLAPSRVPTRVPTVRVPPTATPRPALNVTVSVVNELGVPLTLTLTGPIWQSFTVPAGGSHTVYLAAGTYSYSVSAEGYTFQPGTKSFYAGNDWRWRFYSSP